MKFVGYVATATAKAFMFQDHFWHSAEWVPFSQADLSYDVDSGETTVVVAAWLCKKNGFEEFKERGTPKNAE